ncbi:Hsp20/alpha crystallin family protein [Sutcliffiella horikoshii]|uniref:Hsp20/alpha crystallin family protein n=1 Tax=Sutcliffiella horikoshii TaxID=79883 RepID=A0A5D4T5P8_9BACI|nr:Hsp20/alpha crystallin family protein [Sutcliffiella horikoshii]TYS70903.1 Hsp20/alpha crystallin family protein [Sutcliffiella horikoshii]
MKKKHTNPWETMNDKIDEVLGDKFWKDMLPVIPKRVPLIDIMETEDKGLIIMELPGLKSTEDIQISVKNNQLFIKGSIPYPYPVERENLLQGERFFGDFQRVVAIPFSFMPEKLTAQYKQGLLTLIFQKNAQDVSVEIDFIE